MAALAATQRDHHAIACRWQDDVIAGRVNIGRLFRAAVTRHLADLARQGQPDFPFTFVPNEGARVCRWVELFRHIKGPKAGQLICLDPWQVWILTVGFGWRLGTQRRFRRFSWWFCRGQGKSILAALIALYVLKEGQGAEVTPAATTKKQARLVFDVARWALNKSPDLRDRLGFKVETHRILIEESQSVMEPVSAEAKSSEGGNSSCVVLDELHAHPSRDLYDTLLTGCGKRPGSLLLIISTAPTDVASIGYEVWDTSRQVLSGALKDETEFAVIIQADEGLDPYAATTIAQANPGLGESIDPVWMVAVADKARQTPSLRPAYFSRHLGWVITGTTPYIAAEAWAKCADTTLTLDDFEGEECWIGLDLASKTDLVASAYVFVRDPKADGEPAPDTDEGEGELDPELEAPEPEPMEGETPPEAAPNTQPHFYVIVKSYVNEAAVADSKVSQYPGWAAEGNLIVTPGNVTDYDWVESDVKEAHDRFVVKEIAGDPWQAMQMLQHFQAAGMPATELKPSYANMSEPTKMLEALVLSGRLHHNGDPVLAWAVSNVVLRRDGKDNVSPTKVHPDSPKKIDPVVALIMALARALAAQASQSGYGSRGLRVLGLEEGTPEPETEDEDPTWPGDADEADDFDE